MILVIHRDRNTEETRQLTFEQETAIKRGDAVAFKLKAGRYWATNPDMNWRPLDASRPPEPIRDGR